MQVKFHDKIPRSKLQTLSNGCEKKKSVTANNSESIIRADHDLLAHIVLMAENRKLQMLRHPLEPLPWALATCDGLMRKTSKSALGNLSVKDIEAAEHTTSKDNIWNACCPAAQSSHYDISRNCCNSSEQCSMGSSKQWLSRSCV